MEEKRVAYWEFYESEHIGKIMICSHCGCCYSPYIAYKNYCANCGYKMRIKEEDNNDER